jgi:hypothetical protein
MGAQKVLKSDLHYFVCDFVSVLPQITYVYGNMALIVLCYFHEFKKKKKLQMIGINTMLLNVATFSVTKRSISFTKKKIDFLKTFLPDIL